MVAHEIVVIKKFRDDPPPDHPIRFSKLQNLHLELMENKLKLKPGVPVNPVVKEFKLKTVIPPSSTEKSTKKTSKRSKSSDKGSTEDEPKVSDRKERKEKHKSKKSKKEEEKEDEEEEEYAPKKKKEKKRKESKEKKKSIEDKDEDEMIKALKDDKKSSKKSRETKTDKSNDSDEEEIFDDDKSEEDEDNADNDIFEEEEEVEEEEDEFAGMTPEEKAEYEHKEYLWRFRILKKKYKSADIPKYNQHSDIQMMKRDYDRIVRELQLDDSVDTYKQYLFGGFMAMELICTNFIGIDLEGFTALQNRMMPKYERMLIELGEKSYTTWGSSLPVEIRLIGYVILQAGIFFLAKIIADKFGETTADLFKGFMGQPPDSPSSSSKESINKDEHVVKKPKKKMRGPRINVSDIRKGSKHD